MSWAYCLLISFSALSQTPQLNWANGFIGTSSSTGNSVKVDNLGNVYTVGSFIGTTDFDPGTGTTNLVSPSSNDIFVSKLDQDGNFVWAVGIGSTGADRANSIAIDVAGDLYITGRFNGTVDFDPGSGTANLTASTGIGDIFILKLNSAGAYQWAVKIGTTGPDEGLGIAVDPTGEIIVTGEFSGTVDFDPGGGVTTLSSQGGLDIFVTRFDNAGNFIWAKSIGGTTSDGGNAVTTDALGNILVAGYFIGTVDFDPGPGTTDLSTLARGAFVLKLNAAGDLVFGSAFTGTSSVEAFSIAVDAAGDIYTTGDFNGTIDFDPGPATFNQVGVSSGDMFISKLDASGNFVWAAGIGDAQEDAGLSIAVDAAGNPYVTGHFAATVDFDPGPGVFNLSSTVANAYDIFISKYDTDGNFEWAVKMGGVDDNEIGKSIFVDGSGNVIATGQFSGVGDFDPGSGTFNLSGTGAEDAFVLKLSLPTPTISGFDPTSGPVGVSVIISGTNFSTTPANNTVTFNGTTAVVTASTTTSITTTVPAGATTGPISVTIAGSTATSATDFTVTASPVISINTQPSGTSGCFGDVVTFSVAATGTSNITYQWQAQQVDLTFVDLADGGAYSGANTSTLTVTTNIGSVSLGYRCRVNGDFAAQQISNNALLLLLLAPSAPTTTGASGCSPATVTLSASGGVDGQYRWYTSATGGTAIAGETNSTYTTPPLTSTSTYYVSRMIACESTRTPVTATVDPAPAKPVIISSITPSSGNVSVCSSNTLTLTAPSGFNTYLWSNGETTQQITITSSGSYSVIVENGNGCDSPSSDAITVTVIPAPCANQSPVISAFQTTSPVAGNVSIDLTTLISDADNNLDLGSLKIISQPVSGAQASIVSTSLVVDYAGLAFTGPDRLTIEACDLLGSCTQQEITIEVVGDLIVYTGISPNEDIYNEKWVIENINLLPDTRDNTVSIYNRWGDLVFETTNYDNDTRVFNGVNKNGKEVTSGVYFYKIHFNSGRKELTGYLTVKNN
ncbi:MAG: gliding motility-associated C-terminal domain-containing protein [Cyclobacteriaceae bacterium]